MIVSEEKREQTLLILGQIKSVRDLMAKIDAARTEGWLVSVMRVSAPEGSEEIDILPYGSAGSEVSALALQTAHDTYQSQLDTLETQLAAL